MNSPLPMRRLIRLCELAAAFVFLSPAQTLVAQQPSDATPPPPPPPPAGAIIRFNDDISFRLGLVTQIQANLVQETLTAAQAAAVSAGTDTQHWLRQFQVRRLRLLLGGTIAKNTTIFFDTDLSGGIGNIFGGNARQAPAKTGFNDAGGALSDISVQDMYIQHTFAPEFSVLAGLMVAGISRNTLQAVTTLMAMNFGSYSFAPFLGALQTTLGRDVGVMARGFLANERLEYRMGVYEGRSFSLYSPLRTTARLNYSFLDKVDKGFFYTGAFLNKSRVLNIGGGIDMQGTYMGVSADAFVDLSIGNLGSLTASLAWGQYTGGSDTSSTGMGKYVPHQTIVFGEAGLYLKDFQFMPYLKYETQMMNGKAGQMGVSESANLEYLRAVGYSVSGRAYPGTSSRLGAGFNYFFHGHNGNLKFLWERVARNRATNIANVYENLSTNEFTLQWQWFVF